MDDREVQPVGYSRPVTVDLRVIAATNTDLQTAVQQGRFREDLLFRLDVVRVPMPPLRERGDELDALLDMFNAEFSTIYRQPPLTFAAEAMELLRNYSWPGNIRELRSVVERLYVLRGADTVEVTVNDLSRFGQLRLSDKSADVWSADRVDEIRRETVNNMLTSCRGNVSRAAMKLGVHRSTVYRWLSHQPVPA
jgi:DNA-binding NtrC family response regulator